MHKIAVMAELFHLSMMRAKIYSLLVVFLITMLVGVLLLPSLIPGVDEKASIDLGFVLIELLGLFTVIFCLSFGFFKELENKTPLIELTKPISRGQFLLGKFAGTIWTLFWVIFYLTCSLFFIMLVKQMAFSPIFLSIPLFIYFELVVVSSVAIFFCIFTTSLPTSVLFTLFVYVLGQGSHQIYAFSQQIKDPGVRVILKTCYYFLPNLSYFNLKDRIAETQYFVSLPYAFEVVAYGFVYSSFLLFLSYLAFKKRDF